MVLTSGKSRFETTPDTFFMAYRGSIAHGTFIPSEDPQSFDDIDLMGFAFGEPRHYFGLTEWGSRGTKEIKAGCYDVVLYEIRKAVSLLLQGNPNIMSMLWVSPEHILVKDDSARRLIEHRNIFLGKHVHDAFAGYAHQQLEKMETRDPAELREYLAVTAELKYRGAHPNHRAETFPEPDRSTGEARDVAHWDIEKLKARLRHFQRKGENLGYMGDKRKQLVLEHGYDSKNAAHLIRLLRMCVEFMQTGEMVVKRPDAAELIDIKREKWTLGAVKGLAAELFAEALAAKEASSLPLEPDRGAAQHLLIDLISEHLRETTSPAGSRATCRS
jgi:predicted nucleotidyltransferase